MYHDSRKGLCVSGFTGVQYGIESIICKMTIVRRITEGIDTCDSRALRINKELWMSLHSMIAWIYALNQQKNAVTRSWLGKRVHLELRGSGITLESGAKLETDSVRIKSPTYRILEVE